MNKGLLILILLLIGQPFAKAEFPRCHHVFNAPRTDYNPATFVNRQVETLMRMSRREASRVVNLRGHRPRIKSFRREFFDYLYENRIIRSRQSNLLLADKLIFTQYLVEVLGSRFSDFHMPGMGLKHFLLENGFVTKDGILVVEKDALDRVLKRDFPNGFVVKPLMTVNSAAEGLIFRSKDLFDQLLETNSPLYQRGDLEKPNSIVGPDGKSQYLASGEKYIIQEKVGTSALDMSKNEAYKTPIEYRVHTYGTLVVPDATVSRWYGQGRANEIGRVENYISDFLTLLPQEITQRQAFSFDVIYNGKEMKIIEVNTNFGAKASWSGFTSDPAILGAHVRFFESTYGWNFGKGLHADLLRDGLGNIKVHVKLELAFALEQVKKSEDQNFIKSEVDALFDLSRHYLDRVPESEVSLQSTRALLIDFTNKWGRVRETDTRNWDAFFEWVESVESY